MEFNAQLQNENESLRQQLAEKESQRQELMMAFERQGNSAQEVITELRQKLATALAACKAKDGTILEVLECASTTRPPIRLREALAIQPDDSALKAWLGEPVAKKIKYGVLQFLDGYSELPPDTKIYSPKELK